MTHHEYTVSYSQGTLEITRLTFASDDDSLEACMAPPLAREVLARITPTSQGYEARIAGLLEPVSARGLQPVLDTALCRLEGIHGQSFALIRRHLHRLIPGDRE